MKNVLVVLISLLSFSCATIIQHGPDEIAVTSDPPGADVYLNGGSRGQTPTVLSCSRHDTCRIEVKKEGYKPEGYSRDKVFAGWFLGNLLFGGIIGGIVDIASDNVTKYSTDPLDLELEKLDAKAASAH